MYRAEGSITFSVGGKNIYHIFLVYSSEEKKFRILNKVARKPNIFLNKLCKISNRKIEDKQQMGNFNGISHVYRIFLSYL